ncbi:hypothetical protein Ancab_020947 [Ancistrocladus abbreviatus]
MASGREGRTPLHLCQLKIEHSRSKSCQDASNEIPFHILLAWSRAASSLRTGVQRVNVLQAQHLVLKLAGAAPNLTKRAFMEFFSNRLFPG